MAPPTNDSIAPTRLIIRRPDDWHVHLRDGPMLADVVNATARQFARAIVMPNLKPPVTTAAAGAAYRDRIIAAVDPALGFTPLITCYLTDGMDPAEIARGWHDGVFAAAKLYPAHATTNSAHGVTDVAQIRPALAMMERLGMPLLVHGEVTDPATDIFDREAAFIDRTLIALTREYPALKIVFEHITTAEAVDFVMAASANVAATITPHHLAISRNAMFEGGIRPHLYCLPILKRERHRRALRAAATGTSPKFFLGTDSAPHAIGDKQSACGCAGCYTAPYALESYAKTFAEESALDRFEAFASLNGPAFYNLPVNPDFIALEQSPTPVPDLIGNVVPFHAGETLPWRYAGIVKG